MITPALIPKRQVSTAFHIEHGTLPGVVHAVLRDPQNARTNLGITLVSWSKITPFLRQLNILEGTNGLTEFAQAIRNDVSTDADVAEIVSGFMQSAFFVDRNYRFSFAYNRIVESLRQGETDRDTIAATVRNSGEQEYNLTPGSVSFSINSIRGGIRWLATLDPPVVIKSHGVAVFAERSTCSPLAISWMARFLLQDQSKRRYSELDDADKALIAKRLFLSDTTLITKNLTQMPEIDSVDT